MADVQQGFINLVSALTPNDGFFDAVIPAGWRQGRTAYGGVTSALSYAAAQKAFSDLPPLRSFQTTFIGPVGENARFKPTILRTGKNVICVNVDVTSVDNIVGRTVFIFGKGRKSQVNDDFPAPSAPAPENCELFIPQQFEQFRPEFTKRFDTRLIAGGRPMTGASDPYIRTWSRHLDPLSHQGLTGFICIGDVLPPAVIPTFTSMGPISSVNWQMNFIDPEISTRDGWWHIETRQTAGQAGYSSQIMRYWNTDGAMIAEGTQTVAIFA